MEQKYLIENVSLNIMKSNDIVSNIVGQYKQRCVNYPMSPSFKSNKNGDSMYLTQIRGENKKPVIIRISNHGTDLRSWNDVENREQSTQRPIDPAFSINISIVFIDDDKDITNDCKGRQNCEGCNIIPCKRETFEGQNELGKPFSIIQYVYLSRFILPRYINGLTKAISETRFTGTYKDPLGNQFRSDTSRKFQSSTQQNPRQTTGKQQITTENKKYEK